MIKMSQFVETVIFFIQSEYTFISILIETSKSSLNKAFFNLYDQYNKYTTHLMGTQYLRGSKGPQTIRVATANYSGITDSPFEFKSHEDKQLKQLSNIFLTLFHQLSDVIKNNKQILNLLKESQKSRSKPKEAGVEKDNEKASDQRPYFQKLGMLDDKQIQQFMELLDKSKIKQFSQKQIQDQKQKNRNFKWDINQLDKNMHKGRYCPQYRINMGVYNGRFNSIATFFNIWKKEFHKNIAYSKVKSQDYKRQRQACLVYDYLIYKTIVEYCYIAYKKNQLQKSKQKEIQPSIKPRVDFQDSQINLKRKNMEENQQQKKKKEKEKENQQQKKKKEKENQQQKKKKEKEKEKENQQQKKKKEKENQQQKKKKKERRALIIEYEKFLKKYHSLPYLKFSQKYKHIKKLIAENEVVFLQDVSDQLKNTLQEEGEYTIVNKLRGIADDIIVINKNKSSFINIYDVQKITNVKKVENNQKANCLSIQNFNYKYYFKNKIHDYLPAVCFIDSYMFISLRFASKDNKCIQIIQFLKHMILIRQVYPNLIIVIGGDFNCNLLSTQELTSLVAKLQYKDTFFDDIENQSKQTIIHKNNFTKTIQKFQDIFNITNTGITTNKQRTWLQSQWKKAEHPDVSSRDFLISSHNLAYLKVEKNAKDINVKLLPNEEHPFDHFFVLGEISKASPKKQNSAKS